MINQSFYPISKYEFSTIIEPLSDDIDDECSFNDMVFSKNVNRAVFDIKHRGFNQKYVKIIRRGKPSCILICKLENGTVGKNLGLDDIRRNHYIYCDGKKYKRNFMYKAFDTYNHKKKVGLKRKSNCKSLLDLVFNHGHDDEIDDLRKAMFTSSKKRKILIRLFMHK